MLRISTSTCSSFYIRKEKQQKLIRKISTGGSNSDVELNFKVYEEPVGQAKDKGDDDPEPSNANQDRQKTIIIDQSEESDEEDLMIVENMTPLVTKKSPKATNNMQELALKTQPSSTNKGKQKPTVEKNCGNFKIN